MARINIEDRLHKDHRFIQLVIALKNIDTAIGCLVRAWMLAQKWYLIDDRMIPIDEWKKQSFPKELLESDLVQVIGDKVRMRGADDQFAWLIQKVEAGRKGGQKSRRKRKVADAKQVLSNANQPNPDANPLSSRSPSHSSVLSAPSGFAQDEPDEPDEESKAANRQAWEAYRQAYLTRYKIEPVRNAMVNRQIQEFVKRIGAKEAPDVIRFYVQHPKSFYVENTHAFGLCLHDAETLRTQWAKRHAITKAEITRYEKAEKRENLIQSIERGI